MLSATTPFRREDALALSVDAHALLRERVPAFEAEYARRGWRMQRALDRVYDNTLAREHLGWQPRYDFAYRLAKLRAEQDPRSPLARAIGIKGYHGGEYADGSYPVEPKSPAAR